MDEARTLEKDDSIPSLTEHDITLEKLTKIEEKLKILQEFSKQSEIIRINQKRMLENLINHNKKSYSFLPSDSELDTRRVKFADDLDGSSATERKNYTRKPTTYRPSIAMAHRSKSLHHLLTNIQTWHGEVTRRKSEIENLKTTRQSIDESEEGLGYEEKIRKLEYEKDEITEKLLHYVLQNVSEGKEEYQDFIMQLEEEISEMEDKIKMLQENVKYLKENNIALMRENEILRKTTTLTLEDVEGKYRKSMLVSKSTSSFLLLKSPSDLERHSKPLIFRQESEDKLSLDKESEDSFSLDKQIATWKMDEESMSKNLKKLEQEVNNMEVIQMKLNFVKRYVQKHGSGSINKNTLIDPEGRGSVRR